MQCCLLGCWFEWRIMCSELSFLELKQRDVGRCDSFKLNLNDDDEEDGTIICEPEDEKDGVDVSNQSKKETQTVSKRNKYAMFEEYLSFLTAGGSAEANLNPVLLGYWCNLFKSLLKTHAYEVYNYVFEH